MFGRCRPAEQDRFGRHAQQTKSIGWLSRICKQCHRRRVFQADTAAGFGSADQRAVTACSLAEMFQGGEAVQQGCYHCSLVNQASPGSYFHLLFRWQSSNQPLQFDFWCFRYCLEQETHHQQCLLHLQDLQDWQDWQDCQDWQDWQDLLGLLDLLNLRCLQYWYCSGWLWLDWLYLRDWFHFEYYQLRLYYWIPSRAYCHWSHWCFDSLDQILVRRCRHAWFGHIIYSRSMTLSVCCSNLSSRCIGCFDLQRVFRWDRC